MASSGSSHLKDIDEKFCQCSVCLQQYREPKLLPCLHRYCSDCLKQLIEKNQGVTVISCPECRDEVTIPAEGLDGFKTDFYMKNIVEYIQIQESLEDEKLRECYSCSRKLQVTSYCFKCTGFLCKDCYEFHLVSKSLREHKQHVLSLEDLKSKQMTVEKLADLREAPRCQIHFNDLCLLCCQTCNELPICVTCVHGMHKNHNINDVGLIATERREELQNEMENLNQYKERMFKVPQRVERVKGDVIYNFREKKENFATRYERDMQTIKSNIKRIEENYKRNKTEVENNKERELTETRNKMAEEMKQIKIKYDNLLDEIEKRSRIKLDNFSKEKEAHVENSREQLVILEREFKSSMETFEKEQEERLAKLEEISQKIVNTIGRYKNLTATGLSILEIRNDWSAVQCIPDICKAIAPLREDMKNKFPELDRLSRICVSHEFTEDEESPVIVQTIRRNGWKITGITFCDDDRIVVTGPASGDNHSHITVLDSKRQVVYQRELKGLLTGSYCFCALLSKDKIAIACRPDKIGVFDLRDYSYIEKSVKKATNKWPVDRKVRCITTDPTNNQILVGGFSDRDVYVFDDNLNYHHTLTLPKMIKYPYDMATNEGNLLVCDYASKTGYVVSMEECKGKIIHEFTKPDVDPDTWKPISVSTDNNGLIYIMWMTGKTLTLGKRFITKYMKGGTQLLTAKEINAKGATCLEAVKALNDEKLLVATWNSGELYIYNTS